MCLDAGCTSKSVNGEKKINNGIFQIKTESTELSDSLKDNWTLSKSEIIEIREDTLVIVSTDDFLYYPFGKIQEIDLLNERLLNLHPKIISSENRKDLVYSYKGNELQFLKFTDISDDNIEFDPENEFIQVFSVNIVNDGIALDHNIKAGMNRHKLLNIMNVSDSYNFNDIKIIELVSGLTGIWHYYVFDEDVLSEIIIKTDYYFP